MQDQKWPTAVVRQGDCLKHARLADDPGLAMPYQSVTSCGKLDTTFAEGCLGMNITSTRCTCAGNPITSSRHCRPAVSGGDISAPPSRCPFNISPYGVTNLPYPGEAHQGNGTPAQVPPLMFFLYMTLQTSRRSAFFQFG